MDEDLTLANILLVEDCAADIEIIRYILEEAKMCNTPEVITNGEEALNRLLQRGVYAQREPPDVVFLDLHLPGMGGKEILEKLRAESKDETPVVVLTGGEAECAYVAKMGMMADCIISKPLSAEKVFEVIKNIESLYWGLVSKKKARARRESAA